MTQNASILKLRKKVDNAARKVKEIFRKQKDKKESKATKKVSKENKIRILSKDSISISEILKQRYKKNIEEEKQTFKTSGKKRQSPTPKWVKELKKYFIEAIKTFLRMIYFLVKEKRFFSLNSVLSYVIIFLLFEHNYLIDYKIYNLMFLGLLIINIPILKGELEKHCKLSLFDLVNELKILVFCLLILNTGNKSELGMLYIYPAIIFTVLFIIFVEIKIVMFKKEIEEKIILKRRKRMIKK